MFVIILINVSFEHITNGCSASCELGIDALRVLNSNGESKLVLICYMVAFDSVFLLLLLNSDNSETFGRE